MLYILDGLDPIPVSQLEWDAWMAKTDRMMRCEMVGDAWVGLAFTGKPEGHDAQGRPLLFEVTLLAPTPDDPAGAYDEILVGRDANAWAALTTYFNGVELAQRGTGVPA